MVRSKPAIGRGIGEFRNGVARVRHPRCDPNRHQARRSQVGLLSRALGLININTNCANRNFTLECVQAHPWKKHGSEIAIHDHDRRKK